MNVKYFVLFFILLASTVAAHTLTFSVYDYNTLNPIASANVSYIHDDVPSYILTDDNGFANVFDASGDYYYNITAPGYFGEYDGLAEVTADESVISYLIPVSREGLIRVKFGDLTFCEDREYCVFYTANGRLQGCYGLNETPHFIVNQAYKIKPKLCKSDALISTSSFSKGVERYGSYIWPIMIFVVLVSVILTGVLYGFIRKK